MNDETKKPRKRVPIPGRMSNSAIQELIDATLDIRILGDKKLRDFSKAELQALIDGTNRLRY